MRPVFFKLTLWNDPQEWDVCPIFRDACRAANRSCLRAHARCLTEGVVPGGFGLVLGRFGRSRNAIRVSARWPVCIIMYTRGAPGSTEGLNLGVSWVGWIPEGPHPTSLPLPHLLCVSFPASVASPACTGMPGGVHFFTALCFFLTCAL